MKKPKTVVDAEAALSAKKAEVTSAKEALTRLEGELASAYAALRDAQTAADANLPQCRMVRRRWRTGAEEGGANYVILRRTPGGLLVVRRVGDADGCEYKFKWSEYSGVYCDAVKRDYWSGTDELRDVPEEFLPTTPAAQRSR